MLMLAEYSRSAAKTMDEASEDGACGRLIFALWFRSIIALEQQLDLVELIDVKIDITEIICVWELVLVAKPVPRQWFGEVMCGCV